jgi:hypothetical protein
MKIRKSRRMRSAIHVAGTGKNISAYILLVRSNGGKGPLGRPRSSWNDNIKIVLREIRGKVSK